MLNNKNVRGSLAKKNGRFHIVLSWQEGGKEQKKWESTGLTVTGNKRKAEALLKERIAAKEEELQLTPCDMLFGDYMKWWLEVLKPNLQFSTYDGYYKKINNHIAPYFNSKGITLKAITTGDIQSFYLHQLSERKNSAQTIRRYHANIRKALTYARKANMIVSNPAECVELPKSEKYTANYCDLEDLKKVLQAFEGTRMKTAVVLAAFYGLRRSEVVGLRWESIDFKQGCIYIREKATQVFNAQNHTSGVKMSEQLKNKSSVRTLPLLEPVKDYLLALQKQIDDSKSFYKNAYCFDYDAYVCVKENGELLSPEYVTNTFSNTVKRLALKRRITFHGLRHTCATLLLNQQVSIKEIQGWLGHSSYSTTADIYSHIDFKNQLRVGSAIENVFNVG